jgi:hypothetical protein
MLIVVGANAIAFFTHSISGYKRIQYFLLNSFFKQGWIIVLLKGILKDASVV